MGYFLRYNGEHGQQMKYLENIGMIAKNNSGFRFRQHNVPAVGVFPLGICSSGFPISEDPRLDSLDKVLQCLGRPCKGDLQRFFQQHNRSEADI
jgi:hypothetical protein